MLRIFHSADWHLGHSLHGMARQFEHQQFLNWLLNALLANQADALIVAGDIFDSANPPASAQAQLYDFLLQAKRQQPQLDIILIGGNHDSASRLDAPSALLHALNIHLIGGLLRDDEKNIDWQRLLIPITDQSGAIAAWCGAMPFLRHGDLSGASIADDVDDPLIARVAHRYAQLTAQLQSKARHGERLILTGHCYMVNGSLSELSERRILGGNQHALPVALFPDVDYVALGHLHLAQAVGKQTPIRYSGSPIPLSFDETAYRHSVLQVDMNAGQDVQITPLVIPRSVALLRLPSGKQFASLSDVLAQLESLDLDDLPLNQQPFVELRIRLDKPQPSLRQQIEDVISHLPLRLLKITTTFIGNDQGLADHCPEQRLDELQPLAVFERCYQNKYDNPPPESLITRFSELLDTLQ